MELVDNWNAVQDPSKYNKKYSKALELFVEHAVEAYECGFNESDIVAQLSALEPHTSPPSHHQAEGASGSAGAGCGEESSTSSEPPPHPGASQPPPTPAPDGTGVGEMDASHQDFVTAVAIAWITLMLSPRSLVRWAVAPPVSDNTLTQWQGFVSMIVDAYFDKRMAWYPLDRLALEVSAVQGRSEAQHVTAERARLVFTVLGRVFPQFPKERE